MKFVEGYRELSFTLVYFYELVFNSNEHVSVDDYPYTSCIRNMYFPPFPNHKPPSQEMECPEDPHGNTHDADKTISDTSSTKKGPILKKKDTKKYCENIAEILQTSKRQIIIMIAVFFAFGAVYAFLVYSSNFLGERKKH